MRPFTHWAAASGKKPSAKPHYRPVIRQRNYWRSMPPVLRARDMPSILMKATTSALPMGSALKKPSIRPWPLMPSYLICVQANPWIVWSVAMWALVKPKLPYVPRLPQWPVANRSLSSARPPCSVSNMPKTSATVLPIGRLKSLSYPASVPPKKVRLRSMKWPMAAQISLSVPIA